MLKFFRKIRKDVIGKGRIGNYLAYALGEIILVMVGILLAVEVNNMNKARQLQQVEINILKEMKADLEADGEDWVYNIKIHKGAEESSNLIRKILVDNLSWHDSLKTHFSAAYRFTAIVHKKAAYKNLEAQGVSLIQNDSLRKLITYYYEGRVPYQIKIEGGTLDLAVQDAREGIKRFKNFAWFGEMEPVDFDAMKEDQEYISWLSFNAVNRAFEAGIFERLLRDNRELVEMIEEELRGKF
jgi:hypothetical protein